MLRDGCQVEVGAVQAPALQPVAVQLLGNMAAELLRQALAAKLDAQSWTAAAMSACVLGGTMRVGAAEAVMLEAS